MGDHKPIVVGVSEVNGVVTRVSRAGVEVKVKEGGSVVVE